MGYVTWQREVTNNSAPNDTEPTAGKIVLDGQDITTLSNLQLCPHRLPE